MNRERLVKILIEKRYNWVVGGWENECTDYPDTKMPSRERLELEVYEEVIDTTCISIEEGIIPIQKDIRFLGTERIKELIKKHFDKEGEY